MADAGKTSELIVERLLPEVRKGRMIILVDDEDRENEGDLFVAAERATPETVNFMATHARGLVSLALTEERMRELGLALIADDNGNSTRFGTAFATPIDAREGVTSGMSAHDRARTIAVAIAEDTRSGDLIRPGRLQTLRAVDGGVLARRGHTEAAVDLARLAGLKPAGVICEIMNDDGSMARMPDLVKFAQTHGLKIATIADLIAYRRRTEKLVEVVAESTMHSRFGGHFRVRIYANKINYAEQIALIRGDVSGDEPVLVRMHQHNLLADSLGDVTEAQFYGGEARARGGELAAAMRMIAEVDRGVIVIIREPNRTSLSRAMKEREGHAMTKPIHELRQYGVGAQILLDLGIRKMTLLTNTTRNIVGLDGYGISLEGQQPIPHKYRDQT